MNKKRILQIISMVLLLSMMLSTVAFAMPPGQAKKLLKNKNKNENAFKYMKDEGIMVGYGNGEDGLGDNIKRGDITVMIVRAFKLSMMDLPIDEIDEDDFLDLIDKNNYQYNAVKIAKQLSIAKGDGKNFYPDKFVSYEEAIMLIERAVKVANSNVTVLDEDGNTVKLREWYKEFVKNDKNAFSEQLKNLFKKDFDFTQPATREDIAKMLYFVLTGDEYDLEDENEIKDIKLYLEDFNGSFDRIIKKGYFAKAFGGIENDDYDVEFLIFNQIKGDGELHYKYDAEYPNRGTKIKIDDTEYYFDNSKQKEVKYLTFVAGDDNISTIEYTAYIYNEDDKDYDEYEGKIIISVADEKLSNIKVKIDNETITTLDKLGLKDFIYEIKFSPEKDSKVTIEINKKQLEDKKYKTEDIDTITLIPNDEGKAVINYTAYDEGMSYTGIIEITVTNMLDIKDIEITSYNYEDDDVIDFIKQFKAKAGAIYEKIDYVMFKIPDVVDEGKLFIKYDDDDYIVLNEGNEDDEYYKTKIEGLKFKPVVDYDDGDKVTIFYTAYEKVNRKSTIEYKGRIIIELEKD